MDWHLVKPSWQSFRGEVHASRGRLTPDHLDFIAGRRTALSSTTEAAYSVTADGVDGRLEARRCGKLHPRPASSH
jgi:hypothetical protein